MVVVVVGPRQRPTRAEEGVEGEAAIRREVDPEAEVEAAEEEVLLVVDRVEVVEEAAVVVLKHPPSQALESRIQPVCWVMMNPCWDVMAQ